MMLLSDTRKAKKRRRKDKEKEDAMTEINEETGIGNSHFGRKSRPKSQYSYNKPEIQEVRVIAIIFSLMFYSMYFSFLYALSPYFIPCLLTDSIYQCTFCDDKRQSIL